MPVSKKRRTQPKGAAGAPVVPTRRMREAYMAATDPGHRAAALQAADAIVARGLEREMGRLQVAAAHKALAASPLCTEAYVLLAEDAVADADALDLYQRGVHAAELALAETWDALQGRFGEAPETRPYLVARFGVARMLLAVERDEEAVAHLRALLALNPADEQGVRNPLLAVLLDQHDLTDAEALLARYADDRSPAWLYSRLLVAYRQEQRETAATRTLLAEAMAVNPYIPTILADEEAGEEPDDGTAEPGSPAEATDYVIAFEQAWTNTPGAIAWLGERASQYMETNA